MLAVMEAAGSCYSTRIPFSFLSLPYRAVITDSAGCTQLETAILVLPPAMLKHKCDENATLIRSLMSRMIRVGEKTGLLPFVTRLVPFDVSNAAETHK